MKRTTIHDTLDTYMDTVWTKECPMTHKQFIRGYYDWCKQEMLPVIKPFKEVLIPYLEKRGFGYKDLIIYKSD
jgi:hypothetical protein